MDKLFLDITLLFGLASVITILFRLIKQPPILAFILTGILVGPLGLSNIESQDVLHTLSQLGITLLLFMIGLELKIKELRSVGKVSLITGIGQIVFTSIIGFVITHYLLGFDPLTSLYIAIALTFSSTIIVVKLLTDRKDINSLYGKISIGFLLVQDFFAIIALVLIGFLQKTANTDTSIVLELLFLLLKGVVLVGVIFIASKWILPKVVKFVAKSQETLLLFSLAWAFALSAFVSSDLIGFSIEIGGFLAGLSLANSIESIQISSKVRSLRDFFIIIFFVLLGMNLSFNNIGEVLPIAIILSLFVFIGNPIIVMIILGLMGYKKRTSFQAGLTVAQISEFSLILIYSGVRIGHLNDSVNSLIALVGIITFILSTYAILYSHVIYKPLQKILTIFENKKKNVENKFIGSTEMNDHIIICGIHRMGRDILKEIDDQKDNLLLIDFDPQVVEKLGKDGYNIIYGDISDVDIIESLNIENAKLIISTIPDSEDNMILISKAKSINPNIEVLISAQTNEDIEFLYQNGANIVISPFKLTGKIIGEAINNSDIQKLRNYNVK